MSYSIIVCNGAAEYINETFSDLEEAMKRFNDVKKEFPFSDNDDLWLMENFDSGIQVSITGYSLGDE